MLLIIDNYDSFTYNIVQTLATAPPWSGADWQAPEMLVLRNDAISLSGIDALNPSHLLISPGPCTPKEAGISLAAIRHCSGRIPILGVCLGHQAIGDAFGGKVIRASRLMHGKTSPIHHDGHGVFAGLASPFAGMRYHSLVVEEPLPACLEATAHTDQGELMGLRHKSLAIEGVQFHPESIMTGGPGLVLLHNFLRPDYEQLLRLG
jgi:anthranilate synthase/aminodeoxychorismate synthase-like glutamine amidotransferase